MDKEVPMDLSSSLSDQVAEETGTVDRPTEPQQIRDEGMDTNPDGVPSNGASDGSPQSDPMQTDKPKPKSAFIKVMELDSEDMFLAWVGAFFRESAEFKGDYPTLRVTIFRE